MFVQTFKSELWTCWNLTCYHKLKEKEQFLSFMELRLTTERLLLKVYMIISGNGVLGDEA
jgi:hypothetical protein